MLLDEALSMIKRCSIPELDGNADFQIIRDVGFYYPASLIPIQQENGSKFILISAPGAVGKTTLAKYVASKYGGFYWDISKKPVGKTAFAGEITHAVGIGNGVKLDALFHDLKSGNALFVLDAFDEAELISGREGIREFLLEIGEIVREAIAPSIILTARTGMAQFIRETCKNAGIALTCYDIDYFEIEEASHFIESYVKFAGIDITPAFHKQIVGYVDCVRQRLNQKDDIRSFMGYAQVLSILSRQVEAAYWADHSLESLCVPSKDPNGQKLIYNIIQELISRETSKLSAFKAELRPKYEKMGVAEVIDQLYNKQEQLVRLQFFVLSNGSIEVDDCTNCSQLFPEDKRRYLDLLNNWLPQHVFLRERQIMPIFYDYLLAESLLDEELSLFVDEYQSKLPTQVFMDCYLSLNDNCVKSKHVYYLDLAYSSQAKTGNSVYCDIGYNGEEDDVTEGEEQNLYLTLTSTNSQQESRLCIKIIQDTGVPICLSRAENMDVNVNGKVILEQRFLKDVTIRRASIECGQLELNADEIVFEGYNNEENVLIVHQQVTRRPNGKIKIKGNPKLKVDFPNVDESRRQFYELAPYFHSFDSNQEAYECDKIEDFVFALKKVLEQFKIDNYGGDPAKHKEKIDARCHVGCKSRVLSFLKDIDLIYEDNFLYKARLSVMEEYKINRVAYTHLQTGRLSFVYDQYCSWFSKQKFI